MLTPFIIDQIKRRELEKLRERPKELTLPLPEPRCYEEEPENDSGERGVTTIDLL